jgi:hypothetical protein
MAELREQLATAGFDRSSAKGNGDCFPLSAMAGFEISKTAARVPTAATTAVVQTLRKDAVGLLCSDASVDGIDAATFRSGELLPEDPDEARELMSPWLEDGHWSNGDANKATSFMLGVALELRRPQAVVERSGKSYLDPARVYGARDANGGLVHSTAKPNRPETVPTFQLLPVRELLAQLRDRPTSCSVVEYNGKNHFDPWILRRELRPMEAEVELEAMDEAVAREAAEVAEEAAGVTEEAAEAVVEAAVEEMETEEAAAEEIATGEDEAVVNEPMAGATEEPTAPARTGRKRKRRQRFEDSEASSIKGAASNYRSAPSVRRTSISNDVATDTSDVEVGQRVLALGFAPSGERIWFQAGVTALRPRWPPIVVKFVATQEGDTQPLLLPRPITAYVHRAEVDVLAAE